MYSHIAANRAKSVLLLTLFFAIVVGIGWLFGWYTGYGYSAVAGAAAFAGVSGFVGYFSSAKIALATSGAKPVTKEELPEVYNIVENLAITSGIPMPKLYLIQDDSANAFATGRNPKNAAVAVTTGILKRLDRAELEGVLAHELSHVKNYDILIMTLAVVFGGTISMLAQSFFRFGGMSNRGNRGSGSNPVFLLIGLGLIILAPILSMLIRLAVSRRREYLADASGALLTRYPEGLARALEKIAVDPVVERASSATAHMFIQNPLRGGGFSTLFATHPPIQDRIARLRKMGSEA